MMRIPWYAVESMPTYKPTDVSQSNEFEKEGKGIIRVADGGDIWSTRAWGASRS